MIKLFRNIRQNLLNEGKTTRYFKYAIGEIILVVIGILIALSINNWKENRNARSQEISQLKNLKEDILLDKFDVNWNISAHSLFLSSEKDLLTYMMSTEMKPDKDIIYENALGTPIILTLHESSFFNLRNNDINIITNEKLKNQISNYYDNFSKMILQIENDLDEYKTYSVIRPYFIKYFKYANETTIVGDFKSDTNEFFSPDLEFNKYILTDTLGLKKDEAFKNVLAESISFTTIKLNLYQNFFKQNQILNEAINNELKKLNK